MSQLLCQAIKGLYLVQISLDTERDWQSSPAETWGISAPTGETHSCAGHTRFSKLFNIHKNIQTTPDVKVCKNNSIKFHNIYVNNFTSTARKIFYVQFPSEIKGRSKSYSVT